MKEEQPTLAVRQTVPFNRRQAVCERIKAAWASIRPERRSPPKALGLASPSARHRNALDALTANRSDPNCSDAWRHYIPSWTANKTRSRRSSDSDFDISASLRPAESLNHSYRHSGIPVRFLQLG
jgi:hypothetical protein